MQERWGLQMGTICEVSEGLSNQRVLSSWYVLHYLDLIEVWRFQAGCSPCFLMFLSQALQSIKRSARLMHGVRRSDFLSSLGVATDTMQASAPQAIQHVGTGTLHSDLHYPPGSLT